jgi:hypothetical protein
MATFTSTLPDKLLSDLSAHAARLSVPKNKLIEKALRLYLDHLRRAEYIHSYKKLAGDPDIMLMAALDRPIPVRRRTATDRMRTSFLLLMPGICLVTGYDCLLM